MYQHRCWHQCYGTISARLLCLSYGIRDVVLEASASARGGLEAVFWLAQPRLGLTRSCLGLDLTALAVPHSFCLGLGSVWKVALAQ